MTKTVSILLGQLLILGLTIGSVLIIGSAPTRSVEESQPEWSETPPEPETVAVIEILGNIKLDWASPNDAAIQSGQLEFLVVNSRGESRTETIRFINHDFRFQLLDDDRIIMPQSLLIAGTEAPHSGMPSWFTREDLLKEGLRFRVRIGFFYDFEVLSAETATPLDQVSIFSSAPSFYRDVNGNGNGEAMTEKLSGASTFRWVSRLGSPTDLYVGAPGHALAELSPEDRQVLLPPAGELEVEIPADWDDPMVATKNIELFWYRVDEAAAARRRNLDSRRFSIESRHRSMTIERLAAGRYRVGLRAAEEIKVCDAFVTIEAGRTSHLKFERGLDRLRLGTGWLEIVFNMPPELSGERWDYEKALLMPINIGPCPFADGPETQELFYEHGPFGPTEFAFYAGLHFYGDYRLQVLGESFLIQFRENQESPIRVDFPTPKLCKMKVVDPRGEIVDDQRIAMYSQPWGRIKYSQEAQAFLVPQASEDLKIRRLQTNGEPSITATLVATSQYAEKITAVHTLPDEFPVDLIIDDSGVQDHRYSSNWNDTSVAWDVLTPAGTRVVNFRFEELKVGYRLWLAEPGDYKINLEEGYVVAGEHTKAVTVGRGLTPIITFRVLDLQHPGTTPTRRYDRMIEDWRTGR